MSDPQILQPPTGVQGPSGPQGPAGAPSFSAYLSATINNTTGDGTAAVFAPDTVLWDDTNGYDPTTGIFTAPSNGRLQLRGAIQYSSSTPGGSTSYNGFFIQMVKPDGVTPNPNTDSFFGPNGAFLSAKSPQFINSAGIINFFAEIEMTAGERYYVYYQMNGGTLDMNIVGQPTESNKASWLGGSFTKT